MRGPSGSGPGPSLPSRPTAPGHVKSRSRTGSTATLPTSCRASVGRWVGSRRRSRRHCRLDDRRCRLVMDPMGFLDPDVFEAGVSQSRLEFVAGQGSGNGPRSIPSCPPVSPRSCPGLRSRPSRTIAHLAGVPALDPDLKGIVRDRYVASIRPSAHPHPGPSPQQSPFASGSQQEAPSLPT